MQKAAFTFYDTMYSVDGENWQHNHMQLARVFATVIKYWSLLTMTGEESFHVSVWTSIQSRVSVQITGQLHVRQNLRKRSTVGSHIIYLVKKFSGNPADENRRDAVRWKWMPFVSKDKNLIFSYFLLLLYWGSSTNVKATENTKSWGYS